MISEFPSIYLYILAKKSSESLVLSRRNDYAGHVNSLASLSWDVLNGAKTSLAGTHAVLLYLQSKISSNHESDAKNKIAFY